MKPDTPQSDGLAEELDALYAKATPGQWSLFNCASTIAVMGPTGNDHDTVVHWTGFDASDKPVKKRASNAAFIAAVHNAYPSIRERLERAEKNALPCEGFYLQDARTYIGNDMLWWRKDGNGYTTDLRQAHVFTQADVDKGASRDTDIFWPVAYINSLARPAVDMQHAKRAHAAMKELKHG